MPAFYFTLTSKTFQMKTLKQLALLALFFTGACLHAQQAKQTAKAVRDLPFAQSIPRLRQASDLIERATIPAIKKPAVVHLDLAAEIKTIKDECPYLLAQQPTLQLSGERTDNRSVNLEWETTNGWNNYSFLLERSLDDTLHFETVNSVWAKPVAGIKDWYRQPDENAYNKISYYRVQLQLRDGNWLYSNIAPVKGYATGLLKLYPNPGSGPVVMTLYSEKEGDAVVKTFDAAGKLAVQQTEAVVAGFNTRELNVSRLAGGFYTVKVFLPDKTEQSARLVRQ